MKFTDILIKLGNEEEIREQISSYKKVLANGLIDPIPKYLEALHVRIPIRTPHNIDTYSRDLVIGLVVLAGSYELYEGVKLGTYDLITFGEGEFHKVKNIEKLLKASTVSIIEGYQYADKNNAYRWYKRELQRRVSAWNFNPFVLQEELVGELKNFISISAVNLKVSEKRAYTVLYDYLERIKRSKAGKLDNMLERIEYLLKTYPSSPFLAYLARVAEDLQDGGVNLDNSDDFTNTLFWTKN